MNEQVEKELLELAEHVKDYGFGHIEKGSLLEKVLRERQEQRAKKRKKSPEEKAEDKAWREMKPVFSLELREKPDTNELDWQFDWKENRGAIVVTIKKRIIELTLKRRNLQKDLAANLGLAKPTPKEFSLRDEIRWKMNQVDRDIYVLNAMWKVVYGQDWHESEDREERQEIANYRIELLGNAKKTKY